MPTASDPPHERQVLFDRSVPVLDGAGVEQMGRIVAATLPVEADEAGCMLELTLGGTRH